MSEKYDVAVIGSGSGGSEAAFLAAEKGFRSILIEKDAIGGTRFYRGCFAVRALHASSRVYLQIAKSRNFGIQAEVLRSSLVDWMKTQRAASTRLAEELRQRLEKLNVRLAAGTGSLIGEHEIQITDSFAASKISMLNTSFWPPVHGPIIPESKDRDFSIATI
jgi:dihydrolipoamide dehydrogenase